MNTPKLFDNFEIEPCVGLPGGGYEVCDPEDADIWTLYGHRDGEGVQAIGDFDTREAAVAIYFSITGRPFKDDPHYDMQTVAAMRVGLKALIEREEAVAKIHARLTDMSAAVDGRPTPMVVAIYKVFGVDVTMSRYIGLAGADSRNLGLIAEEIHKLLQKEPA